MIGITASIADKISYNNPGGKGNRSAIITVTKGNPTGALNNYDPSVLVNGIYNVADGGYMMGNILDCWIMFDFGVSRIINEARVNCGTNTGLLGIWYWQASNDNSSWTNIGNPFQLSNLQDGWNVLTELSPNINSYRYYRMYGTDSNAQPNAYIEEMEFKISK